MPHDLCEAHLPAKDRKGLVGQAGPVCLGVCLTLACVGQRALRNGVRGFTLNVTV